MSLTIKSQEECKTMSALHESKLEVRTAPGTAVKAGLKKSLGILEAIAMVIGMTIGSGIFFKPSIVYQNAGSFQMGIAAWIVGGIITMAAGLTVAEIASAIPKTGGLYVYLKELYGEKWAFLLGWVQTCIYVPGSTAALAVIFATQATYFIPMSPSAQKGLAIFMIFTIVVINCISAKFGGIVQTVSTVGKLIPIFIIIGCGFYFGKNPAFAPPVAVIHGAGFGAALLGTLWAYDGWISVSNMAGEFKNPKRDLPRAIILGLSVVISSYVLINIAVIKVLPIEAIIASPKAASDAAVLLFGDFGATLISAGILVSIYGALNGYLMAGSRIPYAMATEGTMPMSRHFSKVNASQSPYFALIFEFALACLYALSGSFNTLTDLVVFVLWIFFVMAIAGVFILRRRTDLQASYKVPFFPFIPLIGIIGGVYILASTIMTSPVNSFVGIGITLLGLPVYFLTKTHKSA